VKISKQFFQKIMLCISIIVILVIFKKYVLHGSVATQLKCGMIFNNYFITNCPKNEPVKNPYLTKF